MDPEGVTDAELVRLIRGELGAQRARQLHAEIAADAALGKRFAALELVHGDAARGPIEGLLGQAPAASMGRRLDVETAKAPPGPPPAAPNVKPPQARRSAAAAAAASAASSTPPAASGPSAAGALRTPGAGVPGAQAFGTARDRNTAVKPGGGSPTGTAPPGLPWRLPLVIATAVGLAILAYVVGFGGASSAADWRDGVAAHQRLYTALSLSEVATVPGEAARTGARLSEMIGMPVDVPDLSASRLVFKRGQLLRFDDRPLVHLAYLGDGGEPVAICMIRAETADHPLVFERRQGLNTAQWTHDGISTIAIGDLPDDRLRAIARASGAKR